LCGKGDDKNAEANDRSHLNLESGTGSAGALKMTDQIAGHENAGHEIARHDKYFFIVENL